MIADELGYTTKGGTFVANDVVSEVKTVIRADTYLKIGAYEM